MLRLVAQFYGDNLACPLTNAMGDIVTGDVEDFAVIGDAAHQDMRVGMTGIVMIDGDPIELGLQINFHLLHQIAGRLADVSKLDAVLGGDDEAELVAIFSAPIKKGWPIRYITVSAIDLTSFAVAGDAIAFKIAKMCVHGLGAHKLPPA